MSVLELVKEAEAAKGRDPEDVGRAERARRMRQARDRLKRDLIDRLGLATVAEMLGEDEGARARSELAVALEAILNTSSYESVPAQERAGLVRQVIDEICGLGPIQGLLDDPEVTEVMVNGCDSLFYEKGGELIEADVSFDSPEQITISIDRILAPLGRRLDRSSPIVNARLANGDRVNAVARPVAIDGPSVTIRKFTDSIRSLDTLVGLGALPAWYAQLLRWAVVCRQGIAVSGGTGSGKTTLLNALSCEIPVGERIVTIEDSAELRFDAHPNVVRLEAQDASIEGVGAVTIRQLVKNALRMRPDRIVVGEVRGEECIDMLQAMNTGHDGSLTTLHAGTPDETVVRLVLMARFGMDLPPDIIREQVATALDLIVMSRRLKDGSRAITELAEVGRAEGGGVELATCVRYRLGEGAWDLEREPAFIEEGIEVGILDKGEVERWRRSFS